MNFKRLLLFLVAPLAMVMGSCTPEEPEYTTPQITITDEAGAEVTAINFNAEGGDKTITIKATRGWEITKTATWFNATPASDTNLNLQEKSVEVKFTAMPNDEAARTETIKIVMDKIEKSIVVSQADAEGNVAGPQGEGTLESPYNVGRAMEIILAGTYTEDMVYTKGIISELGEDGRAQYGNYTFSISDDGTTTGQLLVYRCKYLNGKNFTTSDNLAIGDEVIVCGQLVNFKGNTPEIQSCYIASHNGFMPEPPALKEGVYASDAAFVCNIDNSNDAVYSLGDTNVGGNDVSGFKLGTGSKAGVFTSAAIGVSGDKYLNFYAVAWNGKSATLYYRVQGGDTMSQAVVANTGANNNAPYNGLVIAESDHFSVKLTGLQATDKIEFSTDASFTSAANDKSGRALVFGIKLTDEALGGEAGGNEGGETPEPPVVDGEFIYFDNFDKVAAVQEDGKYWPDMSAEYGNPMPATQSAVTYNSNNATARNNSNSNGSYSDYAGSGVNNVFFGKIPTYLTIGGISLAELEGNALTITFGTERYVKDADNTVKNEEFQVYISGDSEKWSPVTYTYSGTPGRWNVATAQLSLKEVPATLSIHFAASVESAYRLDDLKIVAGGEGAEIDLSQGVALDGIGGGEGGEGGEEPEPEDPENPENPEGIATVTEDTIAMDFYGIKANGGSVELIVGKYGDQAHANASTWYTWNVGDYTFAGIKVCEAEGDYAGGYLQQQGNASDATKQGEIFNTAPIALKTITIVAANTNANYTPSANLYVGTTERPVSGTAVTATTKDSKTEGGLTTFTWTYDLSGLNAQYFNFVNNTTGANYYKSFTITYGEGGGTVEPEPEPEPELAGTGEGTVDSPYDVVRAKAAIDKFSTVSGVFVKGIVTTHATKYNSTYKSCDYYISVDGTTENELMVYSGKFLNGEDFTSGDQIHAGDEVVVCGNLKNYNGTYEFDKTSKIVSLVCNHETEEPEEPELPVEPGTGIELPWIETFDGDLSAYAMSTNEKGDNYIDASNAQLGTAPELMFRFGTYFAATIASDGTAKTLYLTFNANYTDRVSVTSNTDGVTIEKNGNLSKLASYIVNVPAGLQSFSIVLNNIHASSNVRIDNIRLADTEYERSLTSIAIAGATDTFAIGSTYEFDGVVNATYDSYETVAVEGYTVDSSAVNTEVAGTYEVTVTYTEGDITKTASYNVTVKDASSVATYTLTITKEDFPGGSYAANNGEHTKDGVSYYTNQMMNQSSLIQWQKNAAYIYNTSSLGKIESITLEGASGGPFTVYAGTTANPTGTTITGSNNTYDFSAGEYSFFTIKCGGSTGKCSSIKITYTK